MTLDITGGAPEMHPDFRYFIEKTDGVSSRRIVRTNLTVMAEAGMGWLQSLKKGIGDDGCVW